MLSAEHYNASQGGLLGCFSRGASPRWQSQNEVGGMRLILTNVTRVAIRECVCVCSCSTSFRMAWLTWLTHSFPPGHPPSNRKCVFHQEGPRGEDKPGSVLVPPADPSRAVIDTSERQCEWIQRRVLSTSSQITGLPISLSYHGNRTWLMLISLEYFIP